MTTKVQKKLKPSSSFMLVKKSNRVPNGGLFEQAHYLVDTNTVDAVMRAAVEWATLGDANRLMDVLGCCKQNLEVA